MNFCFALYTHTRTQSKQTQKKFLIPACSQTYIPAHALHMTHTNRVTTQTYALSSAHTNKEQRNNSWRVESDYSGFFFFFSPAPLFICFSFSFFFSPGRIAEERPARRYCSSLLKRILRWNQIKMLFISHLRRCCRCCCWCCFGTGFTRRYAQQTNKQTHICLHTNR